MNSNDIKYFRIDHKNSLEMLSKLEESKLSLSIFTTIASVQEDSIGNEINKYFNQLIEKNESDLFEINLSQTRKYQAMFNSCQEDIELAFSVMDVLSTDYRTTFDFNENATENLMRILCHCFNCLRNDKAQYKITNHEEMLTSIDNTISSKLDGIKMFVSNQNQSSFKSNNNNKDCDSLRQGRNSSVINSMEEKKEKATSFFTYPFANDNDVIDKLNNELPIEMVILINKFNCVKKVVFSMENISKKRKMEIISILLNSHWLFPHMLEVEFNLTDENIQQDLNNIINTKMSKKCKRIPKKTTMYDPSLNKGFKWTPKENEGHQDFLRSSTMKQPIIKDYNNYIKSSMISIIANERTLSMPLFISHSDYITKFKVEFFEMIVIYSYFISKMSFLKSLSIKYHDSYSYEIKKILNNIDVNIVDFHFLTFFNKISTITEIALVFNSLDTQSFQEVLGLIHNNAYLLNLRLNLFNSDNNYTPASLYKLCNGLKMNINEIFSDNFFSFGEKVFENDEIDHLIINKLLPCFEENLEKLLFVLLNNLKIRELIFYLDLPKIIVSNDFYIMVLIKFVFNILFMLVKEKHKYRIVKIISPDLWFNCRNNPFIEEYLDNISMERDDIELKYFTIQLGFYHVENIGNMLFRRLEYLFLGDLDAETFDFFIEAYSRKEFIKSSELNAITISLNKTITKYSFIQKSFGVYFENTPKKLKEQNLISCIKLDNPDEAKDIVDLIYRRNKVKFNCIELNEGGELLNQVLAHYTNTLLALDYVFYCRTKKNPHQRKQHIIRTTRLFLFNAKPYAFKCRY